MLKDTSNVFNQVHEHCFMLPPVFSVKRMKMTAEVTMGLILILILYLLPNKAEINPGKHRDPELH